MCYNPVGVGIREVQALIGVSNLLAAPSVVSEPLFGTVWPKDSLVGSVLCYYGRGVELWSEFVHGVGRGADYTHTTCYGVRKTASSFQEHMEPVRRESQKINAYFTASLAGRVSAPPRGYRIAQRVLAAHHNFYGGLFGDDPLDGLDRLVRKMLAVLAGRNEESIRAMERVSRDSLAKYTRAQNLLRMERALVYDPHGENTLPYTELGKVARGEGLLSREKRRVRDFARRLTLFQEDISLVDLWNFLRHALDFVDLKRESHFITRVAEKLESYGFLLFSRRDSVHEERIRSMQEGRLSFLTIGKKNYELGPPIDQSHLGRGEHLIFSVRNHPNCVLRVGLRNPFLTLKEMERRNETVSSVPLARVRAIDYERGLAVVVERLSTRLDRQFWPEEFSPRHERRLDALKTFVRSVIVDGTMPAGLAAHRLMYSADHAIRAVEPMESEVTSAVLLEQFIWDCSSHNEGVYKSLMEESGLLETDACAYYWHIFCQALQHEHLDCATLAAAENLVDPALVARAQVLQRETSEILTGIIHDLHSLFPTKGRGVVEEAVRSRMQDFYVKDASGSILMPSLRERCLHSIEEVWGGAA